MARLMGVDLPRDKRMEVALTYIYGVGRTRSQEILDLIGAASWDCIQLWTWPAAPRRPSGQP